jgi:plastocyanin
MRKILLLIFTFLISINTYAQSGLLAGTGYAPNFTVTDINGVSHTIYDYLDSGYVMVLELMSVTCGHCQSHAAGTENSYQTNGPSGTNVARFLGLEVNASTDSTAVANFASTYGVGFPIVNNVSPTAINYQLYYTPGYYIIYPDYTYTTICGAYCVTTQNHLTVENLLNTAITSWVPPIYGCTDSLAVNYDSTATIDNDSCDYSSYTITTSGMNFVPDTIICDVGDTINFILGGYHNAVEVSDSIWLIGGTTSNGGFNFGFGATGYFVPDDCHTFYYVCQPHAGLGMKGVIIAHHAPVFGCTDSTALNYDSTATVDDGSCIYPCVYGCIDSTATNYNPLATCDDGSCIYVATCNSPVPTGLSVTDLTHDRAKVNWLDANTSACLVEMYRVQYREQGTTQWSTKTALGSGLCNFGLTTTSKMLWNLTPSTIYEYRVKAWYCSSSASTWSPISIFTTLDTCPNVLNFAVSSGSNTQATFSWTAPSTPYSFVRIKLRVDTTNAPWLTAGGFGVMYPALTRNKNGLTAGQSYLASSRTWCNPLGGAHKALTWSSFIYWTQPGTLIRVEDENSTAITSLEVYPNPSRDIFNVTFFSDEVQNLKIRIVNLLGEAVFVDEKEKFIGQYSKAFNLNTYSKGIYMLEIEMDDGVVNKKLVLQ